MTLSLNLNQLISPLVAGVLAVIYEGIRGRGFGSKTWKKGGELVVSAWVADIVLSIWPGGLLSLNRLTGSIGTGLIFGGIRKFNYGKGREGEKESFGGEFLYGFIADLVAEIITPGVKTQIGLIPKGSSISGVNPTIINAARARVNTRPGNGPLSGF
jgi:hypothetical protein